MDKLRTLSELDDPEAQVVPILIDAIMLAETYRGARHPMPFVDELTQSVDALLRHPVRYGLPYGLLLYGVMNYVVLPLSNAPQSSKINLAWLISIIAMHMVFGVMCAWFACKPPRQALDWRH